VAELTVGACMVSHWSRASVVFCVNLLQTFFIQIIVELVYYLFMMLNKLVVALHLILSVKCLDD